METKTIYVPIGILEEEDKEHFYVKTYFGNAVCAVEKKQDMVVMTKAEFELKISETFIEGVNKGKQRYTINQSL